MVKQLEFMAEHLPVLVMEANQKASSIFAQYDFDVLDMHYNMINQTQRRSTDGIHWNSDAVRYQTNSFLTHYCLSREIGMYLLFRNSCLMKWPFKICQICLRKHDANFEVFYKSCDFQPPNL